MKDFRPSLPKDINADMPRRMSELIRMTVDAHSDRDSDLDEYYQMLMRISPTPRNIPFRNSCNIIDPISFEHFLTLFASVRTARSQKPYWLFEPASSADEESASKVEKALSFKASSDGFDAALYDSDWVALRDGVAPMYIGWSHKRRKLREIRYRAKGDPDKHNLITESEKEEGVDYDEVPYMLPYIEREGFEYHVPDLANFYMMTPDARNIDESIGCGERMYYTANDLVNGIGVFGFDEDTVKELIKLGPTGYNVGGEYRQTKEEVSGTHLKSSPEDGIGVWEIFRWFGQLPIWTKGGGIEIPDYLLNDEFVWVMCPYYQKILRFAYSPYQMRPYTLFRMLREPNGQGGESVPSITSQYQEEGTAVLRMGLDSANFRTIPVLKQLASNHERFGVQRLQPGGKILCERALTEIEPLNWTMGQANETLAWLRDIRTRAKSVISGAGYGELQEKVRKAAEVEAAVAAVSAKVSLIVRNLQDSGMERAALIHLSHLSQYGSQEPSELYVRGGKPFEINPEDWKKIYAIKPRGTADDANPAIILDKRTKMLQMVRSSPIYQQKVAAGDMRPEYHAIRQWAAAMEEDITPYFGEEPPPPDYLQVVAQIMGQVYEAMTGIQGSAQQVTPMFMQNPAMVAVMSSMIEKQQQNAQQNQTGATAAAAMAGPRLPVASSNGAPV